MAGRKRQKAGQHGLLNQGRGSSGLHVGDHARQERGCVRGASPRRGLDAGRSSADGDGPRSCCADDRVKVGSQGRAVDGSADDTRGHARDGWPRPFTPEKILSEASRLCCLTHSPLGGWGCRPPSQRVRDRPTHTARNTAHWRGFGRDDVPTDRAATVRDHGTGCPKQSAARRSPHRPASHEWNARANLLTRSDAPAREHCTVSVNATRLGVEADDPRLNLTPTRTGTAHRPVPESPLFILLVTP